MTHTPGRWHLLAKAAHDDHLTTEQRIVNLNIALPKGYDTEKALTALATARDAHKAGHPQEATRLISELIDAPPMMPTTPRKVAT